MNVRVDVQREIEVDHVRHAAEIDSSGNSRLAVLVLLQLCLDCGRAFRGFEERTFVGSDDDVVEALVKLVHRVAADFRREFRVENARADLELSQEEFQSIGEGNEVESGGISMEEMRNCQEIREKIRK
jgi:hypothetical protein